MDDDRFFILNEQGDPVAVDVMTWARWFETCDRRGSILSSQQPNLRVIAKDVFDDVEVSTVFLGLNHSLGYGPPMIFETMIFGGEHDQEQWRYSTRAEALAGHAEAVKLVVGEADGERKLLV